MATGFTTAGGEIGTNRLVAEGTSRWGRSGSVPAPESPLALDITKEQKRMETARRDQDSLWDDLDEFVTSRRSKFNIGKAKGDNAKDPGGANIYDSTAQLAQQDFADNFQGQISSSIIKWWAGRFRGPLRKDTAALKWMDDLEEATNYECSRSPWYEELNEGVQDVTSHGIMHMAGPEWNYKTQKMEFRTFHPRQIFCTFDIMGRPTLWHDKFPITGRQIKAEFPETKLTTQLEKKIEDNPFREYMCIHAIYKRTERDLTSPAATDKPWASVWVLEESKTILLESGYDTNPMDTWIWRKASIGLYCTSMAIDAIYDVMMTNSAAKSLLKATQLAVEPSLLITEGVKGNVNLFPAGQTILHTPADQVKAFEYPTQFQVGVEQINKLQEDLVKKFKANLFKVLSNMPHHMTAFQASGVQGETAAALIPLVTRSSSQMLVPKVTKMVHVLAQAGRLPPPPPSVLRYKDSLVDVDLMGPVTTAARRFLNQQGFNAMMAQLEQMQAVLKESPQLFQAITEGFDPDEIRKFLVETNSAPQKILFDDQKLQAMRQMKQQLAQQQMAQQQIGQLAQAFDKTKEAPQEGSPAQSMAKSFEVSRDEQGRIARIRGR